MKKFLLALLMCVPFVSSFAADSAAFSAPLKEGDGSAKKVLAVYIEIEPEKREAGLKLLLDLVAATQKEDGCVEYTLWADLKSPNTFFLYEEYKDADAFATHQASEHFQSFVKKRKELGGIVMRGKVMEVSSAVHKAHKK